MAVRGVVEMVVRAYSSADDDVMVREAMRLNGIESRGLAKTRIALQGRARSRVSMTTEGNVAHARRHKECTEIVRDEAFAENVPPPPSNV